MQSWSSGHAIEYLGTLSGRAPAYPAYLLHILNQESKNVYQPKQENNIINTGKLFFFSDIKWNVFTFILSFLREWILTTEKTHEVNKMEAENYLLNC